MPFANPTPYDYLPRRLHPQEIGNPFSVINLFFGWENFPAWREHLDEWKAAAIRPSYNMSNEQTLRTFIRYEFIETLIEAVFMICRLDKSYWTPDSELQHHYKMHGKTFMPDHDEMNNAIGYFNNSHSPKQFQWEAYNLFYLEKEERSNPLRVFYQLWDKYNLPHVRDTLYWWLLVSMDYTCAGDSRGDDYLNKFHRHLQRVIEAAHLIYIWNMEKWPRLYP
ncbi:hypothetical protein [Sphingobacterium sp.]|uniref:hypothetical protein n=1 Tax=Sphingobacterium sp. TaxID=341027 RepID=UPI0028993DEC|nr:hypothetical protein [Sphingobacterium sp.]